MGASEGPVEGHGPGGDGRAAPYVVADDHSPEQIQTGASVRLARGQRGGHDGAPGMGERRCVGIVGLVGVGQHPVGQGRVHRRCDRAAPGDARLPPSALRRRVPDGQTTGREARS